MKTLLKQTLVASIFFGISVIGAKAQNVGINATGVAPDAGSLLDIASTTKGLLIPRVNIANLTTIAPVTGSTTESMLVYNTNTTTGKGYYYWDGGDWIALGNDDDWKITGNGNITGGTHFLGTTNAVQLDLRTNNVTRFSVKSNGQQVFAGGNGSNTVPFYSWSSDPNTGMFRQGTDNLAFTAGSVQMLDLVEGATDELVVNQDASDVNMRVESASNANIFNVDAGTDQVFVNAAAPFAGTKLSTYTTNGNDAFATSSSGTGDCIYAQATSSGVGFNFLTNTTTARGVVVDCQTLVTANASDDGITSFATNNAGYGAGWFVNSSTTNGTGYGSAQQGYGILSICGNGTYQTAFYGQSGTGRRNSGVFGYNSGTGNAWGALGYRPSGGGTYYGGYFYNLNGGADHTDGNGKHAQGSKDVETGVGIGVMGGLMGGWIRGSVYGAVTKGDRYSLYVSGRQFTNEVITQLNSDESSQKRVATYVPTSTTVDVTTKGKASMVSGRGVVKFDKNFLALASSSDPVIVTVTPLGQSNGVYIENVDESGFTIVENNSGSSTVEFTWIAIATRKGYEVVENPTELLTKDYETKLDYFMINEGEENPKSQEMWYDGNDVKFTTAPQLPRNPNHMMKESKSKGDVKIATQSSGKSN